MLSDPSQSLATTIRVRRKEEAEKGNSNQNRTLLVIPRPAQKGKRLQELPSPRFIHSHIVQNEWSTRVFRAKTYMSHPGRLH